MIDVTAAQSFLSLNRLALVGASADPKSFGNTIYRELRAHGHDVVPVNPHTEMIGDDVCFPDLASVPGDLDGVIVMVKPDQALEVIRACADRGVARVWLFKGLGAPGAFSDAAVDLCHELGIDVVPGACPMMFLEPVGWAHRTHRHFRRLNHSLVETPKLGAPH